MQQVSILYLHEMSEMAGAENSLLNLAKNINSAQFKPFFVIPAKGGFFRALKGAGIDVYCMPFPRLLNILGFSKNILKIITLIKRLEINIIHSNDIRTHLYASLAGTICRLPVVWHERNMLNDEKVDLERLFDFLPSIMVCNSYAIARRFMRKGRLNRKIKVVYNGVNTLDFSPAKNGNKIRKEFMIDSDEIIIGFVGRFNLIKGLETFLGAAKILLSNLCCNNKKLRFLVVGSAVFDEDRPREKLLKDMADKLGLSEKIIFAGFREDMPEVYACIDILVLPSITEGFGRVVLEAMSSGKPVIGTNTGGTPEAITDGVNGLLFAPGDSIDLAGKIELLIKDTDKARQLGQSARKTIENEFRIDQNVNQIEMIYADLLRKRNKKSKII